MTHDLLDPHLIAASLFYTALGVIIFLLAMVAMVKLTPFSIRKEIEEDQNVALGLVIGAVLLGLAHIIAATISA